MQLGQITLADIFLVILGSLGTSWLTMLFLNRKTKTKNTVVDNKSGGTLAGGSIVKKDTNQHGSTISEHANIVKGNVAAGDIAGGDIEK